MPKGRIARRAERTEEEEPGAGSLAEEAGNAGIDTESGAKERFLGSMFADTEKANELKKLVSPDKPKGRSSVSGGGGGSLCCGGWRIRVSTKNIPGRTDNRREVTVSAAEARHQWGRTTDCEFVKYVLTLMKKKINQWYSRVFGSSGPSRRLMRFRLASRKDRILLVMSATGDYRLIELDPIMSRTKPR